ncbi:hypothetical protein DAPPUDRAFT_306594 [Daphnia pulex]|uniref:Uncharacterized protein n=1 Tax=Daphnia pulex TaxID=6669 RepID=E9GXG8_DAPPU|nr:hypothetical protein DAPPUDRAFT_306594 [Daphnia pulex]|eukprot:EFX75936.1 hypothetical protein DAPPUDRAFT_306594 [Daphnia pulex]
MVGKLMQISSSATGRKPNIVSVNGKPLNVNENDGMENSEIASSYQMAESTEASNDNQMIFVKGFRDCFCTI